MRELITPTEYARRRGLHHTAVLKAIKSNRIDLIDGKIDPDVADIQWAKNTRNPKAAFARKTPVADTFCSDGVSPDNPEIQPPASYDLQIARAKREHHLANLAELQERQKSGELVLLAQVELAYTAIASQLRATLERIPDKLAPRLAAESDEATAHAMLLAEIDQALADIAIEAARLPAKLMDGSRDVG